MRLGMCVKSLDFVDTQTDHERSEAYVLIIVHVKRGDWILMGLWLVSIRKGKKMPRGLSLAGGIKWKGMVTQKYRVEDREERNITCHCIWCRAVSTGKPDRNSQPLCTVYGDRSCVW